MKKSVSLVLGSGGARGYAHIGIIRWLEENGYEICAISGSSMGALIGGLYAAGKLGEYEAWVKHIDKIDILKLLDLSMSKEGFIKGDKVINTLREIVGDRMIEDLDIEFTAVATDIEKEKEVWIDKGPLFHAIRASIAMPLFFTPFDDDDQKLLDGGILNPVPIAPTFNDRTDITIAVNLNGKPAEELPHIEVELPKEDDEEASFFRKNINKFIDAFKDWTQDKEEEIKEEWSMYDIAMQSIDAMQGTIARQKLAAYPPDMLIEIPRNACGVLEFNRATEMIELGYETAQDYFTHSSTLQ